MKETMESYSRSRYTSVEDDLSYSGKETRNIREQRRQWSHPISLLRRSRSTSAQRKPLVTTSGWEIAVTISSHLVPVTACGVLVTLNSNGYFIGQWLAGTSDLESQTISFLALQVTAKLLELIVIASLGLMILDVLHHFLMVDEQGLPLGLSGTKYSFTNILYLLSPSFWSGIRVIKSRSTRFCLALFIIACFLQGTLVGPSFALLLLPTIRANWPAGTRPLFIQGDKDVLWPAKLTSSYANDSICASPDEDILTSSYEDYSGCIWQYTDMIAQAALRPEYNLTVYDYTSSRTIATSRNDESWAVTGMAHINALSTSLFDEWIVATVFAQSNFSWTSQYYRWSNRENFGTQHQVASKIPAARVKCVPQDAANLTDVAELQFPILPHYSPIDWTNSYVASASLIRSPTNLTARFIPRPSNITLVSPPAAGGTTYDYMPSGLLIIQVPPGGSNNSTYQDPTFGSVMTCSINTYWADGVNQCSAIDESAWTSITTKYCTANVNSNAASVQRDWLPVNDGTWQPVELDVSWLNQLFPTLTNQSVDTNGSTAGNSSVTEINTLSRALEKAQSMTALLLQGGTDDDSEPWPGFYVYLQDFVAAMIADGMARTNLATNDPETTYDQQTLIPDLLSPTSSQVISLFSGRSSSMPAPPGVWTRLRWSVTIKGFAYSADSIAYYLSLAVVGIYLIFATSHIFFTLLVRRVARGWDTVPEIVALCLEGVGKSMGYTSMREMNSQMLRLRVSGREGEKQSVKLLLGDEYLEDEAQVGVNKVYN